MTAVSFDQALVLQQGLGVSMNGAGKWLDLLPATKAFDPSEPRDAKGEWTAGGSASADRQGAGAFGDGKSIYTHVMDWRIGRKQETLNGLQQKSKELTQRLAEHQGINDEVHVSTRRELMEVNGDLWRAQHDLKQLQDERDHPIRTLVEGVIGKADGPILFDDVLAKYSEDQPRDARGRFAAGSRSASAGAAKDKADAKAGKTRGRYWLYDHHYNLLSTHRSLASAKQKGIEHTNRTKQPVSLYDSTGHREARTMPWRAGVYTATQTRWVPDKKGDVAWRDTSKEDAVIERFARERAAWEAKNGPVGKAWDGVGPHEYGEFRKAMHKGFDPDEPRDTHGEWTSGGDSHGDSHAPPRAGGKTIRQRYHDNRVANAKRTVGEKQQRVQELQDKVTAGQHRSEDHYWATHGELTLAHAALASAQKDLREAEEERDRPRGLIGAIRAMGKAASFDHVMEKAFNPDEPQDEHGMWSSSAAIHPTYVGGDEGEAIYSTNEDRHSELTKSLDKVYEANSKLFDHASELSDKESDYPEDENSDEHKQWEKERDAQGQKTADALVDVRNALADHIAHAHEVLGEMDDEIQEHANMYGHKAHVGKNLTVGDVHAATALGNQGGKTKARDFLTTIAEIKGGGRIVAVPTTQAGDMGLVGKNRNGRAILEAMGIDVDNLSDEEIERLTEEAGIDLEKAGGTALVHLIRHGATDMNNHSDDSRDRIRAWLDPPLNEDGRKDAEKAAKKAEKAGIEVVVSSDLKRAAQTAKTVGKAVGVEPIMTPKLRPWDLGDFTGKPSKEAYPQIVPYVTDKPDEPVPGGESFNDFTARSMQGLKFAVGKAAGKPLAVVAHYRNMRHYAAWDEAGQPADHHIDHDEFNKKGGPPGDLVEMEVNLKRLAGKGGDDVGKVIGGVPVVDIDVSLMERAIAGDPEALSVLSKAMTTINAPLQLQPLNAEWAKSPFPWDQNALASMKPDEMKPFLGALTDPDKLPVKTVLLRTVSALQDRVDPVRVQSMVESEPDDLPVVIRLNERKIIADGHHRMTARWLQGRKTAQVRYLDLNPQNADAVAVQEERHATSDS